MKNFIKIFVGLAIFQFCLWFYFNNIKGEIKLGMDNFQNEEGIIDSNYDIGEVPEEMDKENELRECRIYFFDIRKSKIIYETRNVRMGRNFSENLIQNLDVPPTNSDILVFPGKIEILSTLKKEDRIILDFTTSLGSDMYKDYEKENIIIDCLVNTFGYAYGVEKVEIKLNGKPYESTNIIGGEGNYFKVDIDEN